MIQLDKVSLSYGAGPQVLKDVDLALEPGSFHFLFGKSGAGKSSLLKVLYLGQAPTRGQLSLFGRNVEALSRLERALLRRRIGVVFQDFRLIPQITVLENVALPLRIIGERGREPEQKARELLHWVGLADCLEARPATLSGGQQQRVAIARAVIGRPALLLADEPTGNVDDHIAMRLFYLFEELNRSGTTVLIATHNLGVIRRLRRPSLALVAGQVRQLADAEVLSETAERRA